MACTHLSSINKNAKRDRCKECLERGDSWVHLRMCLSCGDEVYCDSSKNKHATKHFQETKHTVMKSFQKGEDWKRCYLDKNFTYSVP